MERRTYHHPVLLFFPSFFFLVYLSCFIELQPPLPENAIISALSGGTKKLDKLWGYTTRGTKVNPSDGKLQSFWRCNFCSKEYNILNINRVKIHLSGEGTGIGYCSKVIITSCTPTTIVSHVLVAIIALFSLLLLRCSSTRCLLTFESKQEMLLEKQRVLNRFSKSDLT